MRYGVWVVYATVSVACGSVRSPATPVDASSDGAVDGVVDAVATVDARPAGKRVFVTSSTYAPNFGSVAVADTICHTTASSKLGGTWRAWISLPAPNDVATRLTHSTGPYVLVDGTTIVANSWTDLISGSIKHAIDQDENAGPLQTATGCIDASCFSTWTATDATGAYTPSFDCIGWTDTGANPGITGNTAATTTEWTRRNTIFSNGCSLRARLYCFEQ